MNFSILLTTLALIAGAAHAAECTTSQIQAAATLPEMQKLESACAGVPLGSSTANVKAVCENPKCLAAMKAAFKAFPKCEVQGVSLSAALANVDKACESVGAKSAASSTGVSASVVAVAAAVFTYARI